METFPEMTMTGLGSTRWPGSPILVGWLVMTGGARIPRCPRGHAGGRSPRSTSRRSWPPTTLRPAGEKGAILRREGLYSSLITEWRRARDAGALAGLKQPRGRPAADPRDAQIARLTREKAKLEQELATSRFVVEVQAKLGALLEKLSESADSEQGPTP